MGLTGFQKRRRELAAKQDLERDPAVALQDNAEMKNPEAGQLPNLREPGGNFITSGEEGVAKSDNLTSTHGKGKELREKYYSRDAEQDEQLEAMDVGALRRLAEEMGVDIPGNVTKPETIRERIRGANG